GPVPATRSEPKPASRQPALAKCSSHGVRCLGERLNLFDKLFDFVDRVEVMDRGSDHGPETAGLEVKAGVFRGGNVDFDGPTAQKRAQVVRIQTVDCKVDDRALYRPDLVHGKAWDSPKGR